MINFKPFQYLYQKYKGSDIQLFECFDKISAYLKELIEIAPAIVRLYYAPVGAILPSGSYVDAITAVVPKDGNFLVTANLMFAAQGESGIGFLARLVSNGFINPKNIVVTATTDLSYYISTQQWLVTGIKENQLITLQASKSSGAGVSTITSQSSLTLIEVA